MAVRLGAFSKWAAAPIGVASASSSRSTSPGASQPLCTWSESEDIDAFPTSFVVRNTFIDTEPDRDPCQDRDVVSCPASKIGTMCFDGHSDLAAREGLLLGSPQLPTVGSEGHHLGTCRPCAFLHKQGCANGVQCVFCHLCKPGEKQRRAKEKKLSLQAQRQARQSEAAVNVRSEATSPLLIAPQPSAPSAQRGLVCRRRPSLFISVETEVPASYVVRNTFIEDARVGPSLLHGSFLERATLSCPASKVGTISALEHFDDACPAATAACEVYVWPATPFPGDELDVACESFHTTWQRESSDAMMLAPPAFANVQTFMPFPILSSLMAWVPDATMVPPPPETVVESTIIASRTRMRESRVLQLADAIFEPQLGSPELPTMGSAGHTLGTCKPCGFLYKGGCTNGIQCAFCHLCDHGEKRKRQREKKAELKAIREAAVRQ